MTSIIYGFIIAIWVVLNLIYFRIGSVLRELEEMNKKDEVRNER